MTRTIDDAAIDAVLQQGVDNGAVPHVAAIAADLGTSDMCSPE